MGFSTEFLDYLRYTVADTINYNELEGDGNGQFVVEGTNFKRANSKMIYPRFKNAIKVSEQLKRKHHHKVKQNGIAFMRSSMKIWAGK